MLSDHANGNAKLHDALEAYSCIIDRNEQRNNMRRREKKSEGGSAPLDARAGKNESGASFSLQNRIERTVFIVTWAILAAWTPPQMHRWRCIILRLFGAQIGHGVRIYGTTKIWLPANLTIGNESIIGPRVRIYNQGHITVGSSVVISQGSHLVASTHDVSDPLFQLVIRPVCIEDRSWIAADAFVGPGVTVGECAILGARGVAVRNLEPFGIYGGNPAKFIKFRRFVHLKTEVVPVSRTGC